MGSMAAHRDKDKKIWPQVKITIVVYVMITQGLLWKPGLTLNCSEPNTKALLIAFNETVNGLKGVRPVNNHSTTTYVSIYFTLYAILGVDEKAQLLETMIWFTMSWKNQFLSWDPEQCGTSSMTLPRTMLWVPDVVIDEFVDENNAPETFYAHVTHDGYIKDEMPLEVISSCNLEIFRFPFDTQNCSYTFQSWIHNSHEIKLTLGHTVGEIMNTSRDVMVTKGEWELLDMTVYEHELDIGVAARHQITYYIVLRRQSTMYVVNLIIPSFFLITVDLFSFVLPPQNIDRSAFKMTLILGYTVFLLLMNELLPVTGNTIPLINVFFSMCLALMVGSLLETILITNMMCGSIRDLPMPNWFRVFFLKFLAPLVFMKKRVKKRTSTQSQASGGEVAHVSGKGEGQLGSRDGQTADPSVVELQHLGEELQAIQRHLQKKPVTVDQNAEDWIFVGLIIDRIVFVVYFLFSFISLIAIIVIWVSLSSG